MNPDEASKSPPPARRPRYAGTHPRRFDQKYKELQPDRYPGIVEHVRGQGRTPAGSHVPILVEPILRALQPGPGDAVLDCTLGAGGHARELLRRILPGGTLVGLDRDAEQLERTRVLLADAGDSVTLHALSFAWAGSLAGGRDGTFDAILADLGLSSMQIDDPDRGFSYREDGPLDMRMDRSRGPTARHLLDALSGDELAGLLHDLADEPDAAAVARAIVAARDRGPIGRTSDLARIVLEAKGWTGASWRQRSREPGAGTHPAARTFQALRMRVNDETGALERLLDALPSLLRPGGRVAILSFHSGEDRRVKHAFRDGVRGGLYEAASDEPLRASPDEVRSNPRAAPARLRWAVRAR